MWARNYISGGFDHEKVCEEQGFGRKIAGLRTGLTVYSPQIPGGLAKHAMRRGACAAIIND
jgi:hypothetical protein